MRNLFCNKKLSDMPQQEETEFYSMNTVHESKVNSNRNKYQSCVLYAALLIVFVLFAFMLISVKSPNIKFNSEKTIIYNENWEIKTEGSTFYSDLPFNKKIPAMQTVVFSTVLPESDSEDVLFNSIMFRAAHEYIKVYLEDDLLYEFGYDQGTYYSDEPGNGNLIVRLPDGFEGKTLSIEKKSYYDGFAGVLNNVYLGTKNALVFFVLNECLPAMFINSCIILLSICLLISSAFIRRRYLVYQLRYLSIFSLIISVWLLLESGGYQFFAGKPLIVSNAVFIIFSLIPIAFVRFLMTYDCFSDSRYMKNMFSISIIGFLVIHLLQLTGMVNYFETIIVTHIVVVLLCVGIIRKYLYIKVKKQYTKERYLFVSCFAFGAFACIDLVRFYFFTLRNPTLFSQIGWFFYFIILCYFAIQRIIVDNENSISKMYYEKMAYIDILTGLPNRNAFEHEMDYYRKNTNLFPTMLVADLNKLKDINDAFGHSRGDSAIIQIAGLMKQCYGNDAHIFRIGGDEFCAVFQSIEEDELRNKTERLHQLALEKSKELTIPISVAIGNHKADEKEGIDKAFNIADSDMYENKRKIKESIKKQEL